MNDPNEAYPTPPSATRTHTQGGFTILSRKLPILKAGPIDAMSARIGIPIPEMIFGDNLVSISHPRTGWSISFSAEPALDTVDKTGASGMLRVAYAGEWSSSREKASASAGISEVVRPFDWSYSCSYRGDEVKGSQGEGLVEVEVWGQGQQQQQRPTRQEQQQPEREAPAGEGIPLELLKRRDPILFADEVVLYESELDDNGISVLSVKFRVMEQRMLVLCRLFMRLDNVLVRVRDTRVYVDFERELVIREYTAREDKFDNVKRVGALWNPLGVLPEDCRLADVVTESLHERAHARRHHCGAKRLQSGGPPLAGGRALARERLASTEVIIRYHLPWRWPLEGPPYQANHKA
jgi:type 2A phosphatase activator TIP41